MALRSMLRKGPAVAGALRPPLPRLSSPSLQALAPAAGARAMSQAPAAATRQTTREMLQEEGDSMQKHTEFMKNARRESDEHWAKLHRQLDITQRLCNVFVILSVVSLALQVSHFT